MEVYFGELTPGMFKLLDTAENFSVDLSLWSILDISITRGFLLKLLFLFCLFYPVLKSCGCAFGSWCWKVLILDLIFESFKLLYLDLFWDVLSSMS